MNIVSALAQENSTKPVYIGIRAEDYCVWERRTPLIPRHIQELTLTYPQLKFVIQPSKRRIFSEKSYQEAGATISEDLSKCSLILGIKRPKNESDLLNDKTYLFFGHFVKAQQQNMPLLDSLIQKNIRFFDIECMQDDRGKRVLTFGKYGGIAGTIDFLAGLGQFILQKGYSTPLLNIGYSYKYFNIQDAYQHIQTIAQQVQVKKLPQDICPLIFAVTGKGVVSEGTWEVFQNLPIKIVQPEQLEDLVKDKTNPVHRSVIYVTSIDFRHMVKKIHKKQNEKNTRVFNNEDFKENPQKYYPIFHEKYLPFISVLFNNMYWDSRYPRLIENSQICKLQQDENLRLLGVCDVSCDLKGSIEMLDHYTNPDKPFYIYDTLTQQTEDQIRYKQNNILYMAYDSLPCLLPNDSSNHCSSVLKKFVPSIAMSDKNTSFQQQNLPAPAKNGLVVLNKSLTPDYEHIEVTRQRKESLQSFSEATILQYMTLKLSGHLFDTSAINEITAMLQKLKLHFHFADYKVGNHEKEPSSIVLQITSSKNDDKLKTTKYGIEKICEKSKITIEDLVNTREMGKINSSYRMKL